MRTNAATAQKAQDNDFLKSHLLVVKPNTQEATAKVINFKATAEEVTSEAITDEVTAPEATTETAEATAPEATAKEAAPEAETVSIYEVIEKVNAEFNAAPETTQAAPAPIAEVKPVLSIEDIKRKSEVLSRLSVKWDSLAEKRRRVENFAISHDGDTASAIIRDAQGEVFESNSPKTIGQLIEFWKAEFSEAIANVEKEMREIA
jgi:hypothetical protein